MAIDNESPPGSWKEELKAAPWGYGQSKSRTVEQALAAVRAANLWEESTRLTQEITLLRAEIDRITAAASKHEWVGLTDEEFVVCFVKGDPCENLAEPEAWAVMKEVEAKLREKNT